MKLKAKGVDIHINYVGTSSTPQLFSSSIHVHTSPLYTLQFNKILSRFQRRSSRKKKKKKKKMGSEEKGFKSDEETQLTVCKTSLFFAGDGFTAYDCKGQLIFRVDSYSPQVRDKDQLILMDASGRCLVSLRRKFSGTRSQYWVNSSPCSMRPLAAVHAGISRILSLQVTSVRARPSLHNRWEGYLGEGKEGDEPIFSVKRSWMIGRSGLTVEIYQNPGEEYQIEGSFSRRTCTMYDAVTKEVMAEIRRKVNVAANVVLGKDVFSLLLKPGFDAAFAMALVLVLDQVSGRDDGLVDVILADSVVVRTGSVRQPVKIVDHRAIQSERLDRIKPVDFDLSI
ncbi:hypothetical protein Cgig2_014574 [Carnegiea gigantea]|uniref:Protein LURP-one-related 5-like n=1 Tax=Carnegiea gigantea TaxID=171969 RepID=A0A9Q1L1S2_9CARY|nr:hypothetical protein Cgig2_014574 [Carnegiea gigantea]